VPVERELRTDEARALLELTGELASEEIAPKAAPYESEGRFPREVFHTLGRSGLLGLPYAEEHGGGGQPHEVYLQVVEELAAAWLTVGLGVSVHTLACFPLARFGSAEQRERWLPDMLGGETLGAYCLSEPQSGSDAAALSTRAVRDGDAYVVEGTKAWITHAGVADFYDVMVRTSGDGPRGISCLLAAGDTPGLSAARPERKMGMHASPTAQVVLDSARVPSSPMSRSAGTRAESSTTWAVGEACMPIFRSGRAAESPGVSPAASRQEMPRGPSPEVRTMTS